MAKDISAVGARIVFSGGLNLTISEFSDEGTPFDAPDVDVSTNAKNLNGEMISSRTPSVYPFSVTVIPGSVADYKLHAYLQASAIQPGNNAASQAIYCDCTISIPNVVENGNSGYTGGEAKGGNTYSYTNCRIKSGPTGPTTSAEGRLGSRTYAFEAEGFRIG